MSKTVTFFLSDLQNGGTEWFAINLARSLKSRGYTPSFLLAQVEGDLLPEIENKFPIIALNGGGYSLAGMAKALPALIRYLQTSPPDVLISGLPLVNIMASLGKLFSRSKTKLVIVEHVRLSPAATQTCWLKHQIKMMFVFMTHLIADHVVCVSQTVARDISEFMPLDRSIHNRVIYNPVIPSNIEALANAPVSHPWLTPTGATHNPLLVSIGRLLENKSYPELLSAFAAIRKYKPDARLIILGEGDERATIERKRDELGLQDCVSLPGAVPNIFPYLKAASLFVLASHSEAFGNVIVEALACGVPVVSTDCGGPREILKNGTYGLLVQVGNEQALADGILHALDTPVDHAALKERGGTFSIEKATDAYQTLIES